MRLNMLYGLGLFIFLTTGCTGMNWNPTGGVYHPRIYPIPSDLKVKEFQGQGKAISIKSKPVEVERMTQIGSSYLRNFYADQKEVTDVTISFLTQELSKRGFSVEASASKSLILNAAAGDFIYSLYSYRCSVKIEYITSDGHRRAFISYNASGIPDRSCDGAITKAVVGLLNDEKLIDFLVRSDLTIVPQVSAPEKPIKSTPITPPLGTTRIFTWDFSVAKAGPGDDYAVIATFRKGDKLTILEQSGKWVKVLSESNQIGWIRSEVLE